MKEIYWTKERVFEESKKYDTRSEFAKKSQRAYQVAWANNWLNEMQWLILKLNIWDGEKVLNESKKYKTRTEFQRGSGSAYHYARLNNLLDDMIWLKRPSEFNEFSYCVYVYIDDENKVAYVGLTRNKNDRHYRHTHIINENKLSPVYKYFTNIGKNIPNPKYLEDNISCDDAREKEDYWKNWYSNNGYTMLNKGKTGRNCGSIGGMSPKWSKKKVFEESKKYTSKKEFEIGCVTAYYKAWKNKWLKDMYWLIPQKRVLNKELIFNEAKKYTSLNDFHINSPSKYSMAIRYNLLKDMTWLKYNHTFFTDDDVIKESKKYTMKCNFKKYSPKEYSYAVRHKLLEQMTWLQSKIKKWTKEEIIEESKKYKTKMELYRGNNSAYTYAWKNHMLDDLYPKEVD